MHDGILTIIESLEMDELARRRLIELLIRVQGDRSQRIFARDLGVSPGALQNWLLGRVPSSENLERIAAVAGMSIQELFNQINGESPVYTPQTAQEVLEIALHLNDEQRRLLIKLLVDNI